MRDRLLVTWRGLHPALRWALAVWVLLVVAVTLRAAIATRGSVFPIYAKAATNWLEGQDLYRTDGSAPFRYHPSVAVAFVPWTLLHPKVAAILWRWLGVGLLMWGISRWLRHLSPRPLSPVQHAMLLLLMAPLALQSINNAQVNVHLIAFLLLGLVSAFRQQWMLSASLLAAATIFKLYPLAIGLLLLAAFPRQFGFRFLAALALGMVLPFFAQNAEYVVDQYRNWIAFLRADNNNRFGTPLDLATRDLGMLLRVWGHPISMQTYQIVEMASAFGVVLLCLAAQRRASDQRLLFATILNLGCLWMTLLGPATESNTYTLLAPTAALLLVVPLGQRPRWLFGLLACGYALIVASTLAAAFPIGRGFQERATQPAGALLLLIAAATELGICLIRPERIVFANFVGYDHSEVERIRFIDARGPNNVRRVA
jgi:hypothetical protein